MLLFRILDSCRSQFWLLPVVTIFGDRIAPRPNSRRKKGPRVVPHLEQLLFFIVENRLAADLNPICGSLRFECFPFPKACRPLILDFGGAFAAAPSTWRLDCSRRQAFIQKHLLAAADVDNPGTGTEAGSTNRGPCACARAAILALATPPAIFKKCLRSKVSSMK